MRNDPRPDHLLAELMRRCFQRFAVHLAGRAAAVPRARCDSVGREGRHL